MRVTNLKIFILLFTLTNCGQFQSIFDPAATSVRPEKQQVQRPKALRVRDKQATLDVSEEAGEIRQPITTKQGVYYFVKPGDTLARISDRYKIEWEHIAQINGLYDSDLVVGRRLFIPHKRNLESYVVITKVISQDRSPSWKSRQPQFEWPIEGIRVTSVFGHRRGRPHDGIDIGAKVGTPVMAAEEGRVIFAERFAGYGNLIVIKHPGDYFTAYAHNSDVYVRKGQRVKKGQKISLVGMTGRTTGPHLHFEMRLRTQAVDPLTLLPKK